MFAYFPVSNEWKMINVSSKSQMKTLSGALVLSVKPESDIVLRVGLGWACLRPRVRPVLVVGVVAGFDEIVFGDIDSGDIGECE